MASYEARSAHIYDVIGIGFGPANLAIAGALLEQPRETCSISVDRTLFIERQLEFRWHPGMLLPGARMQISFLKDLATLRSPNSPITFVAYLHSKNRLVDFINRGNTTPTRKEYADYLAWVARYVQDQGTKVAFGEEVIGVEEAREGTVQVLSRLIATGEIIIRRAKNLIISPGGAPWVPRCIQALLPNPRIIHTAGYLSSVEPMLAVTEAATRPLRIAVVGAGQSAAEVLLDLHSRLNSMGKSAGQTHELHIIIRGGALRPSDGGPFANEIYSPDATNILYNLPGSTRKRVLADYLSTNYGAVNPRTLESLYEVMYDKKVEDGITRAKGNDSSVAGARITIMSYHDLLSAEIKAQASGETGALSLIFQNTMTKDISEATYDAVVCATGYERHSWLNLLKSSNLGRHFGLSPATDKVSLAAERDLGTVVNRKNGHSRALALALKKQGMRDTRINLEREESDALYISRRYRLLPTTDHEFSPKIYLQGCTEETHGLSETLLSVMGIRAGELVEDLCSGC
ncbi:hypothetical protein K503DRAFT_542757 [Rhizopogon vinicolor AM-OR11-026]|uniref:L-ornithine N(5)-monooxygenase [NAD(P)H] n=1 Tax=Rhizopogon vinicolor AM-OR11-026 TaxID=1314800 RepID=A0A1B7NGS5_9AGAM|nr:hypothetical protein K503DRAFT_542757 [Rhizopogon vinicolor AM-OR11-026]